MSQSDNEIRPVRVTEQEFTKNNRRVYDSVVRRGQTVVVLRGGRDFLVMRTVVAGDVQANTCQSVDLIVFRRRIGHYLVYIDRSGQCITLTAPGASTVILKKVEVS